MSPKSLMPCSVSAARQQQSYPAWMTGYEMRNFSLVFWDAAHGKGPRSRGWPEKIYSATDWRDGYNVGVKLGVEIAPGRHLVDVDFDWTDGIPFAKRFLPKTDFGFGRQSKPISHAFYTTTTPVVSQRFDDVVDKKPFVELRGTTTDGKIGFHTMLPPSVHPSGELLELRTNGEIGHCDSLPRAVALYATACLLLRHLGQRGFGHDVRLAAAGFLLQCGLSEPEVIDIGEAVADATGNDVSDMAVCVRYTAKRISNGEKVTGQVALAKAIGEHGKAIVARICEWLGSDAKATDVVMEGGKLTAIVDRAEEALLSGAIPIFQRGGTLIRPIRLDRPIGDGLQAAGRESRSTMLLPVGEPWLVEQMGQALNWYRPRRDGGRTPADPKTVYARTLLSRGEWRFPLLRGVLAAPTLARDGRIIEKPGYDADSGLLLDFGPGTFPPLPASPTRDDALAALVQFATPLRAFPFVDDPARSVALSAMLTALIRPSLRTAPLHAFGAPTAGTGKSKLAEGSGLLATGCRPPALSQGKNPEEDEKRLSTILFAGDPVIHIDNADRAISGDFLCSMLTQEVVQARILGLSERRVLPCTALVLASGNNLTFAGDMSRRAVLCRLDAKMERPDTRMFDFDYHAEILARRPELVVAGLTVLRAYALSRPPMKLRAMGSFEDWAWVRGALVWLACADPAETRDAILGDDPRREELANVLAAWDKQFGNRRVEVGEIAKGGGKVYGLLCETCRGGVWNSKSVGWWLRGHKDRVVESWRLQCEQGRNGQVWWLAKQQGDLLGQRRAEHTRVATGLRDECSR